MVIRLNSIPPVVAVHENWDAHVASGVSIPSHTVVGITAFQSGSAFWSPETNETDVIVRNILAADVASEGTNLFADMGGSGTAISGSGNLEHFSIAGIAFNDAPIQAQYNTWGFVGVTPDVTHFASTYGGTDKFGDPRKLALRQSGLIWIKFSGTSAPIAGEYVLPSSGTDGFAELCTSGTAAININYGKVYGYVSGTNLGGVDSTGAGVGGHFVLVDFSRGNW